MCFHRECSPSPLTGLSSYKYSRACLFRVLADLRVQRCIVYWLCEYSCLISYSRIASSNTLPLGTCLFIRLGTCLFIRLGSSLFIRAQCGTGWRRPIGCLKLQVIFRKRATNYRELLREMTYKDKTSYRSAPPCIVLHIWTS